MYYEVEYTTQQNIEAFLLPKCDMFISLFFSHNSNVRRVVNVNSEHAILKLGYGMQDNFITLTKNKQSSGFLDILGTSMILGGIPQNCHFWWLCCILFMFAVACML